MSANLKLEESFESKKSKKGEGVEKKEYDTQLTIHSVQNLLGNKGQETFFEEKKDEIELQFGKLDGTIDRFGASLSDMETRVMEGILRGFTKTNYKGNMPPTEVSDDFGNLGTVSSPQFSNYKAPRLRVTQSEILKWCNMPRNSIGKKERVVSAIRFLGDTSFCFYYDRLAFDDFGKPVKLSNGKWKKEPVTVVSSLFTIKEIKHENSEKHNYYEITPSPIFLDQRENYFIMLRNNWREEVIQQVGKKKVSKYTFLFLMFLCCQYELKRRSVSSQRPYQITWKPEDIAAAIKMPASIIKKNKKRMSEILDDAYSVAKAVGYLESYERFEHLDCLRFDESKYYDPSRNLFNEAVKTMAENKSSPSKIEQYLFDVFHKVKQEIDSSHSFSKGDLEKRDFIKIREILKSRSAQDVEKLINWGLRKKFWCTQLNTICKLQKNFDNAWLEMQNSKKPVSLSENKEWASKIQTRVSLLGLQKCLVFEIFSKYLELGSCDHPSRYNHQYQDKEFKRRVLDDLKKFAKTMGFNFQELVDI